MKITVIGCGRWGSCVAWYLDKTGHNVTLYGREKSENMKRITAERSNGSVDFSNSISFSTDLNSVTASDVIVISINSQGLSHLMKELKEYNLTNKIFVLCMKGIEISSLKRLSEIVNENTDKSNKAAVWLGPGHVQEFLAGIPNCMVIDSDDEKVKNLLVDEFSSNLIRFYYGEDLLGNEIGAAAKNVIGIAAGMLDGLKLTTLKGSLMSRGTREISRLIKAMGGNELSAYGLCHLGDYEATVFSKYSHNREFGECIITGESYNSLAEGYYTVKALKLLGEKYRVDLPICNAVYSVLYENADAQKTINLMFMRDIKSEFYK